MRTHVDLFSGIGGFALAAQANDVQTVSFCEIDERCRDFLAKAWPGVDIHDDVRSFDGLRYRDATWLLTAGVPCQPASRAGKQRGSDDDRWLWPEAIRVLSAVRPTWALFENPPGIGDVGLAGVLSDVEDEGYETKVFSIPACAVGAPHRRERYWIVCHRGVGLADATGARRDTQGADDYCTTQGPRPDARQLSQRHWANAVYVPCADGKLRRAPDSTQRMAHGLPVELLEALADEEGLTPEYIWQNAERFGDARIMGAQPHRSLLGALGNSIVPQVAERIIAAMVEAEQ